MDEQPETDSAEVDDLTAISGLLDEQGELPDVEDAAPQDENTADEGEQVAPTASDDSPEQTVEVDYEGAKYRVPANLKDAILRQADYTRKTQEVASQRAAVEQERQAAQRLQQEAQHFVAQYAVIQQIDSQLNHLQNIDWARLAVEDPLQNLQLRQSWTELLQARQGAVQALETARQQRIVEQTKQYHESVQRAQQVLAKELPEWGPELQKALLGAAQSVGYRPEELATLTDPRAVKLLHKAYLYDQLQSQKTIAEKQVKQVPPKVVRPTASHGPATQANPAMAKLRKTGSDADAVAALLALGIE